RRPVARNDRLRERPEQRESRTAQLARWGFAGGGLQCSWADVGARPLSKSFERLEHAGSNHIGNSSKIYVQRNQQPIHLWAIPAVPSVEDVNASRRGRRT